MAGQSVSFVTAQLKLILFSIQYPQRAACQLLSHGSYVYTGQGLSRPRQRFLA